jgi:hypothetical protein
MSRCRVDPELNRSLVNGFAFPLGAYPVEPMTPAPGYSVEFEAADSGEDAEFEEWPDRYVYEIVISAERLEPLCRSLFGLISTMGSGSGAGRIYPILDYLGHDQYREVDPYISYELMGLDRLLDSIRRYRGFFFEDGLCGFGAMTDDPFLYIFVSEHKVVTVRCEPHRRERIERILQAFDLEQIPEPAGADAADHEHRTVLTTAEDRPDLLTADEIVEDLRDEWNLVLNVDPESNLDEEGNELGITPWRCLVRMSSEPELEPDGELLGEDQNDTRTKSGDDPGDDAAAKGDGEKMSLAGGESTPTSMPRGMMLSERIRYADVILIAGSLHAAEDLALDAVDQLEPQEEWEEAAVIFADRIRPTMLTEFLRAHGNTKPENSLQEERIIWTGWLE